MAPAGDRLARGPTMLVVIGILLLVLAIVATLFGFGAVGAVFLIIGVILIVAQTTGRKPRAGVKSGGPSGGREEKMLG
ncbi:MAG TPA: hypothetical protein VFB27_05725 [Opitutaceae bacterium]|nr:hypothetical protein [Opitutaceae bacterium]